MSRGREIGPYKLERRVSGLVFADCSRAKRMQRRAATSRVFNTYVHKRVNSNYHAQATARDAAIRPALAMSTGLDGLCSARCVRSSLSVGDLHRKQLVRTARNVSSSIRDSRHLFDLALGASGFSVVPAFRISFAGLLLSLLIFFIRPRPSTDTYLNPLLILLAAARSKLEPAYSE